MNRAERFRQRGDVQTPPNPLRERIAEAIDRVTTRIVTWFRNTGNRPAECTVDGSATATATQLTITITITKAA